MSQSSTSSDTNAPAAPSEAGVSDPGQNAAHEEFIERAGRAYFETCQRMARAINRLKGRRKKR